jgi:hypothetical protein
MKGEMRSRVTCGYNCYGSTGLSLSTCIVSRLLPWSNVPVDVLFVILI